MNRETVGVISLTLAVVKRWKFVGLFTTSAAFSGIIYALLSKPVYHADATIMPKETKTSGSNASSILAQIGGIGGAVATQLGLGSADMERMKIILLSHDLAEWVVEKNDLLPVLFPKRWDAAKKTWKLKGEDKPPTKRAGAKMLAGGILALKSDEKRKTMIVGINFRDSTWAANLVDLYLRALNDKIKGDIVVEAEANIAFLGKQLSNTVDPLLREKIQQLMANEIEKSMLVSSRSFDVLETAFVPDRRIAPVRSRIVLIAMLMGLLCSVAAALSGEGLREAFGEFRAGWKNHT